MSLITESSDGKVRLWDARTGLLLTSPCLPAGIQPGEVPVAPVPVPTWLPDLAGAVVCRRLNSTRAAEFAPDAGLWKLRHSLTDSRAGDFYRRWATWVFQDPGLRANSPFSIPARAP